MYYGARVETPGSSIKNQPSGTWGILMLIGFSAELQSPRKGGVLNSRSRRKREVGAGHVRGWGKILAGFLERESPRGKTPVRGKR